MCRVKSKLCGLVVKMEFVKQTIFRFVYYLWLDEGIYLRKVGEGVGNKERRRGGEGVCNIIKMTAII